MMATVSDPQHFDLISQLTRSQIYRDYERAFSEATGLPLAFHSADRRAPALRQSKWANDFCRRISETSPGCKLCLEMQQKIRKDDGESHTDVCDAGLTDTAVPVRFGSHTLGFLQTGQVMMKKPGRENFRRIAEWLERGGAHLDWKELEAAYLDSPVLNRQQYKAIVHLLEVFASHLSLAAEQIATQQNHTEPVLVTKAREYIAEHQDNELTLADVAQAVHASTFHFCKTFKKATGFTFTQYLSIVRVAKAKQLLANPQKRISEIAYEIGFQSLTHFNRIFRKVTGQSPTQYRDQALAA